MYKRQSQKDRDVQAVAEQAHNKAIKTNLKTVVKKADAAIDAKAADKLSLIHISRLRSPAPLIGARFMLLPA